MGAGAQIIDMPAAFAVGQHIGTIFQYDAYIAQPLRIIFNFAVAGTIDHASDQDGFVAIQIFCHQHAGTGGIRGEAAACGSRVDRCAGMRCRRHFHNIPECRGTGCGNVKVEGEGARISGNQRIGGGYPIYSRRALLITETCWRLVCDLRICQRQGCAIVGDGQRVGNKFTRACHSLICGLLDGDIHCASIHRDIHMKCRANQGKYATIRAARGQPRVTHNNRGVGRITYRSRQVGSQHSGGKCIPLWRQDDEPVIACSDLREAEAARDHGGIAYCSGTRHKRLG